MKKEFSVLLLTVCLPVYSEKAKLLTLSDCVEIGLKNNIGIRIQKSDLAISQYQKEIAESSQLPDFSAAAGYTYIDPALKGRIEMVPGTDLALKPRLGFHNNYSLALQMRYVLYSGGKISRAEEAAQLGEEAAKLLLKDRLQSSKYEIRKAFIQAVFLKEMVHLAEESLKRSSDRLKDTEAKFKAGSVTKIEMLRIRAENSESETFFSETRDRYKAGTDQLKLLLNLPIKEEIEISGSLKIHPDELKRVFSLNLSAFTPVFWKAQAAGIQAKQAGKLSEMEKSDMLPAVAVGMKADEANPYLLQDKFGTIYSGFIQASMPVWDWGKNKKKYLISQEQKIKAESIAEDVRNQLEAYYSILTDRIQSIKKGINSREKNLDRSKAARDAAETARKNGAATYNDWADTELLHFRLEVDYLKNLSDLYISIADLERFIEEPTDIFSGFETDSQRKNR
ncbi:MAG TPA: TolC family protein [Leptospiraceae bacterium]|nr:TolC family protein [Leptospiraceae bacterium]HMY66055.1 TolC family protein [Leptospiraceae bacterium]HMZ57888.1 TolC family protein [Leptospiraceae bacterium]HNF12981.1 TolC family protein [Leptospiraceae bacterium]HNF23460.1 TolC family protein [Leptospiraceae bacterium]